MREIELIWQALGLDTALATETDQVSHRVWKRTGSVQIIFLFTQNY
jgi:hypothetical protein